MEGSWFGSTVSAGWEADFGGDAIWQARLCEMPEAAQGLEYDTQVHPHQPQPPPNQTFQLTRGSCTLGGCTVVLCPPHARRQRGC